MVFPFFSFLSHQIRHLDVFDEEREFGPVFNDTHFLLPLLKLQESIESIVAEDGTTFQEICNAPLSPQSKICNIQTIWAYWQGDKANLAKTGYNEAFGHNDTYLDHFLLCARYTGFYFTLPTYFVALLASASFTCVLCVDSAENTP